tara:strand:- start:237 stop:581 length:345 start_codon:yes stop_codon:yes gene_type:complete
MSGLKNKLETEGSNFTKLSGGDGQINVGATKASKLHGTQTGEAGYSIDGAFTGDVNDAFQAYDDGVINQLPQPSGLDLNGVAPTGPNADGGIPSINSTFAKGAYINNVPEGKSF